MGASTRSPLNRRQRLRRILPGLAAILIFTGTPSQASPGKDETSAITMVQPAIGPAFGDGNNNDISLVPPGSEGLTLSARFSDKGEALVKDVSWTIHNMSGAMVYDDKAALADITLEPGIYVVNADYGNAHLEKAVHVQDGIKLNVNLVLNAGGLRLLPRLEGALPTNVGSITKIYAMNGSDAGKLIATSLVPGEILKLVAGTYRIESSFERGNEIAVTQVDVKPGILTAVEIDHHAALVHFIYRKVSVAGVTWDIRSGTGEALPEFNGSETEMILKPGHYLAAARSGLEVNFQSFTIEPGQNQEIVFGN